MSDVTVMLEVGISLNSAVYRSPGILLQPRKVLVTKQNSGTIIIFRVTEKVTGKKLLNAMRLLRLKNIDKLSELQAGHSCQELSDKINCIDGFGSEITCATSPTCRRVLVQFHSYAKAGNKRDVTFWKKPIMLVQYTI